MSQFTTDGIVPSACAALLLLNCYGLKECKVKELDLLNIASTLAIGLGELAAIKVQLVNLDVCVVTSIAAAFVEAGCPLPDGFDPNSLANLIPDLTPCLNVVNQVISSIDQIQGILGPFTDTIDVELSGGTITKLVAK